MKSTMLIAMTALAVQHAQAQLGEGEYMPGGRNQLDQEQCESVYEISDIEALLDTFEDEGWEPTSSCWYQVVEGVNYWIEFE